MCGFIVVQLQIAEVCVQFTSVATRDTYIHEIKCKVKLNTGVWNVSLASALNQRSFI